MGLVRCGLERTMRTVSSAASFWHRTSAAMTNPQPEQPWLINATLLLTPQFAHSAIHIYCASWVPESQIGVFVMTTICGLSTSIKSDCTGGGSLVTHSYPGNPVSKSIGCHSVSSATARANCGYGHHGKQARVTQTVQQLCPLRHRSFILSRTAGKDIVFVSWPWFLGCQWSYPIPTSFTLSLALAPLYTPQAYLLLCHLPHNLLPNHKSHIPYRRRP
ncbi:hypothetical protein EDB86DRAFT_1974875 [Lactarius hatsudake]|nr:hypothetical protein EDB86DRAFT_1974875 [Lactarius hatsudake]